MVAEKSRRKHQTILFFSGWGKYPAALRRRSAEQTSHRAWNWDTPSACGGVVHFLPRISQNDRTTAAKQIVCSLKGHKSFSRDNYFIGNDIECPFIRHEKPKRENREHVRHLLPEVLFCPIKWLLCSGI
jgi:hypothetical protein